MMQYRPLGHSGMKLSALSLGGAVYGNVYGKFDRRSAIAGLNYALDQGINYIDTSPWYGQGQSEKFIGEALQGVPRSKYCIGTKVGRYERSNPLMFDFSAAKTLKSVEKSLQYLGLEYVDVLQVHDIEFAPSIDIIVNETLPTLEKLQQRGLCQKIGITGYNLSALKSVVEKSHVNIDSVLSYCRLTLIDASLIDEFKFFLSRGIGIINASPIAMGLLLPNSEIPEWHPSSEEIKVASVEAAEYCSKRGVDISRLALKFSAGFTEVQLYIIIMFTFCT